MKTLIRMKQMSCPNWNNSLKKQKTVDGVTFRPRVQGCQGCLTIVTICDIFINYV